MTPTPNARDTLRDELKNVVREGRWAFASLSADQLRTLRVALILMSVAAGANAGGPLIVGVIVDAVLRKQIVSLSGAVPYLAALAILYVFREYLTVKRKVVVEQAATDIEKATLLRAASGLFHADLAAPMGTDRVGAAHNRLKRSVDGLVRYIKLAFLDFVPAVVNAVFAIIAAVWKQPLIGTVMILIVPAGAYIVVRQLASQRGVRLRLQDTKELMAGTIVEQLEGLETVRVANAIDRELRKTESVAEALRADEMQHHRAMAFFDALKSMNEGVFHVLVIGVAIQLNVQGVITAGGVLAFSMLYLAAVTPIREIHRILDEAHESSLSVATLREIFEQPPDISFLTNDSACVEDSSVEDVVVEADNLTADYLLKNAAPKRVLDGVSFAIRRGEIIGIAGASGSGKSTLLRVLLRLTHPSGGRLAVNGVPIDLVSRESIARTFGFVSQSPFIFAGTVFDNIAYEGPSASAEDVAEAAELAQVAGDIRLRDGAYDAVLEEHGDNLSGGQIQRIALSRAFLKKAPLLILDEATSALDNVSESKILEAVRRSGWTVIMVAHRTTSLRFADRILMFEHGRIVESGTFADLKARQGAFAALLRAGSTPLAEWPDQVDVHLDAIVSR